MRKGGDCSLQERFNHPSFPLTMKQSLIFACLFLVTFAVRGADPSPSGPAELRLATADVESAELTLELNTGPRLRVYLSKDKCAEFKEMVKDNLGKQIPIYLDGKFIVAPISNEPFTARMRYLTMRFADFDSAAATARLFVPTK